MSKRRPDSLCLYCGEPMIGAHWSRKRHVECEAIYRPMRDREYWRELYSDPEYRAQHKHETRARYWQDPDGARERKRGEYWKDPERERARKRHDYVRARKAAEVR